MGDLLPFRKRRKTWTRPEDYGRVLPTRTWRGEPRRKSWAQAFRETRPWLLLIALCTLWVVYDDAGAFDPPGFLEGEPVRVDGAWTRCGPGRATLCVVDGDTLKLGERKVRLVGMDAPETAARCSAEAVGAQAATRALLDWTNAGPFELVARLDGPTDKYGRELMTARRTVDGRTETAAEALRAAGVARRYAGEARRSWC
jgi:micrococcal nuclease